MDAPGQGPDAMPPAAASGAGAGDQPLPPPEQQQQQQQLEVEYWFSDGEEDEDWEDEDQPEELDVDELDEDSLEDEDEDEDEDLDVDLVEADAVSDSSQEPEDVAERGAQLATATAGRVLHAMPAAFSATSDSLHFQSADALALAELPGGDLLAATFDRSGVAAWRLPAPGALQSLGLAALPAERLGGFDAAPLDCAMYTLALSPCGRWLAAGGDNGAIAVYSLDTAAPPRPPLPPGTHRTNWVDCFYTPRPPIIRLATSLGVENAVITAGDTASGADEGGPSSAGQQQQEQERRQDAAVMLAGIIAAGWSSEAAARQSRAFNDGTAMVNGLRFGLVGGRIRLLAAEQSGYVYAFELPTETAAAAANGAANEEQPAAAAAPAQHVRGPRAVLTSMLCHSLGAASQHWQLRPLNLIDATEQLALGVHVERRWAEPGAPWFATAAIGPFGSPCNCAVPSPDGRYIAVTTDQQQLTVVDQADGFAWRAAPFDIAGSKNFMAPGVSSGAQYVAWNADASLLAVSSDTLHAVFAFDPASLARLLRVEGHRRPCLPISFAPWDRRLLLYGEEAKHVWCRRVEERPLEENVADDWAEPRPTTQLLRLPIVRPVPGRFVVADQLMRRLRVTGLATTRHGELLVATKQGAVLRYLATGLRWRLEEHGTWPLAFRAAVRELLLCAARQPAVHGGGAGLWSLPHGLLLHIVGLLAGQSRSNWLRGAAPLPGQA